MNNKYPENARCAADGCNHKNKHHDDIGGTQVCRKCIRGLIDNPKAVHAFEPIRLCGNTFTKDDEHRAYRAALEGA